MKLYLCLVLAAFLSSFSIARASALSADELPPNALIEHSAELIESGKPIEAIAALESAADQGMLSPSLSYNRGIAYSRRAKTASAEPNDWGQAAAAFEESAQLDEDPANAEYAAQLVREEITRSNSNRDGLRSKALALHEVILLQFSPAWMAALALIASVTLGLALLSWTLLTQVRRRSVALAAMVLSGTVFFLATALFGLRQFVFDKTQPAVVIAPYSKNLDSNAQRHPSDGEFAQGELLWIREFRGNLVRVTAGPEPIWLRRSNLRPLGSARESSRDP
ncbi:MAG: hypothetical protein MK135_00180 [Polyangiaceae bacterium]|nr:hypothetical protein [Polyangiaceae bacterium]